MPFLERIFPFQAGYLPQAATRIMLAVEYGDLGPQNREYRFTVNLTMSMNTFLSRYGHDHLLPSLSLSRCTLLII